MRPADTAGGQAASWPPSSPSSSRAFLPLLDPLRILASVAVVRHHVRQDFLFGVGFGLPLFLVVLFALAATSARRESLARFVGRKARYLLVPWLRWSLIYLAIVSGADLARGLGPAHRLEPAMLLYGGHRALWFLPFAVLALVPTKALARTLARTPPASARIAVVAAGALGALTTNVAAVLLLEGDLADMPWRAWLRPSPAIFWGLALAQCLRFRATRPRALALLGVGLLAVASWALSPWRGLGEDLTLRFAVAVPLACLGFAVHAPVPSFVRAVAGVTFGVYLIHPLVGKVLGDAFDASAWPASVHTAAAWGLAAAGVVALRRAGVRWHECAARADHDPSSRARSRSGSRPWTKSSIERRTSTWGSSVGGSASSSVRSKRVE